MNITFFAALALAGPQQAPQPLLWLTPKGELLLEGKPLKAEFSPGTNWIQTAGGMALDLHGQRGGIRIPDRKEFHINEGLTISVWLYLNSYVVDGPGAQILFRGDDRNGLDPYYFALHSDGTVNFCISQDFNVGSGVGSEIPLTRWVHVVANFSAETGYLNMWLNGEHVSMRKTNYVPFLQLENAQAPGIGIGNVQNSKGPHNQPVDGRIGDLRLYRGAFSPNQLGFGDQYSQPPLTKNRQHTVW